MSHRASAALAALLLVAPTSAAQSLDVFPGYEPNGPDTGYVEVFPGDELTFQLALPWLDHAESLPVSAGWATFLLYAVSTLAQPLPLAPGEDLWLDPATLIVLPVPQGLELQGAFPGGAQTGISVPFQVAALDLATIPLVVPRMSPVLELGLLTPPTRWGDEMRPVGALASGSSTASFDAANNEYVFTHAGPGGAVEYVLDLDHPDVANASISILERLSGTWVVRDAGMTYAEGLGQGLLSVPQVASQGTHTLLSHGLDGPAAVRTRFRTELPKPSGGTAVHDREYRYELVGRSLEIHARVLDEPGFAADRFYGFTLGAVQAPDPGPASYGEVHVPYMDQIGITTIDGQRFHSAFVDLFRSGASSHVPAQYTELGGQAFHSEFMLYEPLDDATLAPVDETAWVTLSTDVRDVFVESTAPASPYAAQLEERVGVTFARDTNSPTLYLDEALTVQRLASFGLSDMHLLKFHWMHFGTNRRATTHAPPNPEGGAEQQFVDMIQNARNAGWLVALYTDFYSLDQAVGFDDNPHYSESPGSYLNWGDGLRDGLGTFREGYQIVSQAPPPTPSTYFTRILAPRRSLKHFHREADAIADLYQTNAAYFDVMTISAPDLIQTGSNLNIGAISGDHRSPNDRSIRDAIDSYKSLFTAGAQRTGGPVVGEGSFTTVQKRFDTFYAGYLDGTYRTLSTGGDPGLPQFAGMYHPVVPDYEWNHVRGKHFGFAMGQYVRFFDSSIWTLPTGDDLLNELRATQISYGHNGWFMSNAVLGGGPGGEYVTEAQRVKEYYTMRALQHEWTHATHATVEYRDASPGALWMDLSTALLSGGVDLVNPVLRVTLDSGLVMVVNHADPVVTELGCDLPKNGWVIVDPSGPYRNLAHLHPSTGTLVHHVVADTYEMADGNGVAVDFGGALGTTTGLKVVRFDQPLTLLEGSGQSVVVQ